MTICFLTFNFLKEDRMTKFGQVNINMRFHVYFAFNFLTNIVLNLKGTEKNMLSSEFFNFLILMPFGS